MKHKFTFGEVTTTDDMPALTPERIAYIEARAGEEIPALLARIVQDGLALGTFPVVRGLTSEDLRVAFAVGESQLPPVVGAGS